MFCKPGDNLGEYKFGCSQGTINVWTTQTGWSPDCQVDGIVAIEGESNPNNNSTGDMDNDGIPDSEDDMIEDADQTGSGAGKPDWWEQKNPGK